MVDSTLAFDILARDRGASGVFERVARSADKTSASLAKTGKVSESVAKSSEALSKAHAAESDALDKVQVAEAKLANLREAAKNKTTQAQTAEAKLLEIRNDTNSTTSEIAAAEAKLANARNTSNTSNTRVVAGEKALSKARREAASAGDAARKASKALGDTLDDEGKKAGGSLGSSLKRWFTGDGKNVFKQVGEDGGTVFGSGLLGALKTPILGPAIIAVVGGVVATVMPAVGAIAGTALVAGFGVGIGALGLVFAAKSEAVKAKWKTTLTGMGKDLTLLSQPFEATLSNIADYAQRTFNNFKPVLAKAFTNLAEPIDRFANDSLRALDRFAPAIAPIVTATGQVLAAFGGALPGAIQNMAEGFAKLSRSVASNPTALADTVSGLGNVVRAATDGITTLNDLNGKFERLTGGTSAVDVVMGILSGTVGTLFGTFHLLNKALDALGLKTKDYKAAVDITGKSQELWTQGLSATELAAMGVGKGTAAAAGGVLTLDQQVALAKQHAAEYTTKLNDWLTAMFRVQGLAISLSGAQIGLQQAIDDATASVKANGKATDINSEKGRANRTALNNVAKAANDQTEAMNRSKVGIAKSAQAAEVSRANFVKLARQMGYSKPVAEAMARAMIAIPNVTREAKLKANKADLDAKLVAARKALADPKLTATKKAKLEATIASLLRQIQTAQGAIDSIHGKTVGITIKYSSTGVNLTTPSSVGRRAAGGPVKKGQPYVVGEHRPELFVPRENGTIIPDLNKISPRRSSLGGSSSTTVININVNGALDPTGVAQQIQQMLLKLKNTNRGELGLA